MGQIAELLQDKAFLTKLSETTTPEEAQAVFNANGADLTLSQLKVLRAQIVQKGGGELSPDDLELVSGGYFWNEGNIINTDLLVAQLNRDFEPIGNPVLSAANTVGAGVVSAANAAGSAITSTATDAYNWVASWGW
jgi:hypothetical protein